MSIVKNTLEQTKILCKQRGCSMHDIMLRYLADSYNYDYIHTLNDELLDVKIALQELRNQTDDNKELYRILTSLLDFIIYGE